MAKNILKSGLTLFVVGVLLGFAVPYIATAVGFSETAVAAVAAANTPLWTGGFLGGFGAINAAVAPLLDFVFSKKDAAQQAAPSQRDDKSPVSIQVNACQPLIAVDNGKTFQEIVASNTRQEPAHTRS